MVILSAVRLILRMAAKSWFIPQGLVIWMLPKIGVPQNRWFIMEYTLLKWMIWGYPYFRKHPYDINLNNARIFGGSPTKSPAPFAVFDPLKMGNLMTPVPSQWKFNGMIVQRTSPNLPRSKTHIPCAPCMAYVPRFGLIVRMINEVNIPVPWIPWVCLLKWLHPPQLVGKWLISYACRFWSSVEPRAKNPRMRSVESSLFE